jgi:sucrose-6F-phosphate phosphohydrolase
VNVGRLKMDRRLLLCTDLDRTLLPNGVHAESPEARKRFCRLAARGEVILVYVTGRHRMLIENAIADYALPQQDFAIADVGTTIYNVNNLQWDISTDWQSEIASDWGGVTHDELMNAFADIDTISPQEAEKQNCFKLSFYLAREERTDSLKEELQLRLSNMGVRANLVFSVDDWNGIGLLDILPFRASKLHAIEFLMSQRNLSERDTVYAGDSGNDLPVLVSSVRSILVANASTEVAALAVQQANALDTRDRLYLAQGGYAGMNGNYSAGILEGLAHYIPESESWWREF